MKKINAIFLGILLLTFSVTLNPIDQSYATSSIEDEASLKKQLVEDTIIDALDTIADDKSFKKIEKAQNELEKGNSKFNEGEYKKAIKHYDEALKKIQKALNEPHAKKMKMKTVDEGSADLSHPADGIDDIYIKIKNPGKTNKSIKIDLKIRDICVNGVTHDDAAMKMAFSTGVFLTPEGLVDEGFTITNKWFKKNDENKKIDPFTTFTTFFKLPDTGDDMIQKHPESKKGSFDYNEKGISEIGEQTGWEGSFEFEGNPGEYKMNFFLPLTSPTNEGDDCNIIASIGIPITIK